MRSTIDFFSDVLVLAKQKYSLLENKFFVDTEDEKKILLTFTLCQNAKKTLLPIAASVGGKLG